MTTEDPRIKRSYLFEELNNSKVRCNTCNRFCIIEKEKLGYCQTRKNIEGELYNIQYGDISSYSLNPIEKKPAYHFYPTTTALTLGSWGCNIPCDFCQNYEISKRSPPKNVEDASLLPLEKVIETMKGNPSIQGISFSFNEPTLSLEYILDTFSLLDPVFYKHLVSNGYMSTYALDLLIDSQLDGITISLKGPAEVIDKKMGIKTRSIWKNMEILFKKGLHLEIVYLVIPDFNDKEEYFINLVEKVKANLSIDIPIHFNRYFPHYLFEQEQTPIKTLQKAHGIARKEGLNYVYIGNIPGHPFQSTYCPICSELLFRRDFLSVTYTNLTPTNKCPNCYQEIPIYPYRKIKN